MDDSDDSDDDEVTDLTDDISHLRNWDGEGARKRAAREVAADDEESEENSTPPFVRTVLLAAPEPAKLRQVAALKLRTPSACS